MNKIEKYQTVKITLSQLKHNVEIEKLSIQELMEEYGLPMATVKKMLKEASLKPVKKPKPRYILFDDTKLKKKASEE